MVQAVSIACILSAALQELPSNNLITYSISRTIDLGSAAVRFAGSTSSHCSCSMRVTTLKGAQRVVSACMAAPVRRASAMHSKPAAAAAASCSLRCSSSSQMQHTALAHLSSSSSSASRCRMQRLSMRAMASAAVATRAGPPAPPKDQVLTQDPNNNVTEYIYSKMGINLHHQPNHPIGIIKQVSSCVSLITAIYIY